MSRDTIPEFSECYPDFGSPYSGGGSTGFRNGPFQSADEHRALIYESGIDLNKIGTRPEFFQRIMLRHDAAHADYRKTGGQLPPQILHHFIGLRG